MIFANGAANLDLTLGLAACCGKWALVELAKINTHKICCSPQRDLISSSIMVRAAGLEPAWGCPRQIFLPLRLSPPHWRSWSGLSLHRALIGFRCCPSSLYTFRLSPAWLGITSQGFPEFEQFYTSDFPDGTQVWSKSVASTISPRPHNQLGL